MFIDMRHQNSHSQLLKGSDETAAQTVPGTLVQAGSRRKAVSES